MVGERGGTGVNGSRGRTGSAPGAELWGNVMAWGGDRGKLGHVFVEMMRELGQNCGEEGWRTGSSLWIGGGSGSNVNVCGRRY